MSVQHPSTVKQPTKFTATQIFDEYLPKILKAQKDIAKQLNAVCVFEVKGKGGGVWTVDLPNLKVKSGNFERPDMRLDITVADFDDMLVGKLDVVEAVKAKRLVFNGRPDLLVGMAALLRPASN